MTSTASLSIATDSMLALEEAGPSKRKKKNEEEIEEFRCLKHRGGVFHDIFISYRVITEKKIADKLALLLDGYTKRDGYSVRTFLDSNCLLDGGDWERNFLSALHHSSLVVLIISEAGLDLPSSDVLKTKIQNADKEQDNCLLEYEYAMRIKETGRARLFVLFVAKDSEINGIKCRVKFPLSPEEIKYRLDMYEETGPHAHRDKTFGPPVIETMTKLMSIATEKSDGLPNFAHIDPDDVASRIPDILRKLEETEGEILFKEKARRWVRDIAYLKTKIFGILAGMILPILSLCFTLSNRSPRQKAMRFGIVLGHSIDIFFLGIACLGLALRPLSEFCGDFTLCSSNFVKIYPDNPSFACTADLDNNYCPPNLPPAQVSPGCVTCFCNGWLDQCNYLQSVGKADLFIAIIILGISFVGFTYCYSLLTTSLKKKLKR